MTQPYGWELILDLHACDVRTFTREQINRFFRGICKAIDMTQCERFFWDDEGVPMEHRQTSPHTTGVSAVQFILTSSIVIHTLTLMGSAYVNIFSCKDFDADLAREYAVNFFGARHYSNTWVKRTGP